MTESQPSGEPRSTSPQGERRPSRPKKIAKEGSVSEKPRTTKKKKKAPRVQEPAQATAKSRFGGVVISETTLLALEQAEYLEPTPVQAGVIPRALAGVDLMAQAQTGTGKTAAFAIPILEKLPPSKGPSQPRAIVLTPTRELAVQVRDEIAKLSAGRKLSILAVYGGKPIRQQTEHLKRGVDILVGTPGRVLDHMDRRTLRLDEIQIAVLDEADRMLDIGFRPDIEKILRRCPASRQTLLFSATIAPPIKRLAERYMHEPEMLDFSPKAVGVDTIEQFYFTIDAIDKFDLLVGLLRKEKPRQAIIFCRTKRGTEKVYQRLAKKFESVATIHGDLVQRVRDRVMGQFRQGTLRHLVATDVVGRGIDVSGVSHIVNYDIPQFADDFVHRVGRTGRMGREGVAFTFVTPEEGNELTRIEMRINRLLVRKEVSEYTDLRTREKPPVAEAAAAPVAPAPDGETAPPVPERKTVFGRPARRIRRAL